MKAAKQCSRGVRWKRQVQLFMADRLVNCARLYKELHDGIYKPTPVAPIKVIERGKVRWPRPVNFRDRVVQRCICDYVLIPAVVANMTSKSSACLKGRGLSYAFDCVREIMSIAPWSAWVLQFDFSNYFASIPTKNLLERIERIISDKHICGLLVDVMQNERGLDLGSQVNQVCATWYPDDFDRHVMAMRGCVGYHRYMDDGIAVFVTKRRALAALERLPELALCIGLTINSRKTHITPIKRPIVFCKARFRKRKDVVSCVIRKPQSRRSIKHLRRALRHGIDNEEGVIASIAGYINRGDADLTRLIDREVGDYESKWNHE
jgi:hypothetical protein